MFVRMYIPFYAPRWLHESLRKVKHAFFPPPPLGINIDGERHVEWSFLSKEMPDGPGEALEFGCENGYMSLLAAQKGFHVIACDLQQQYFTWQHPGVEFRLGDFLEAELPVNHFDLLINCSSVEHVGVVGRYGITAEQSEGDIEVMHKFARVLKPGGMLLMTVPCGQDAVMTPWCRVYGAKRLPRLTAPFVLETEAYWRKDAENRWVEVSRDAALAYPPKHDLTNPHGCSYALAGFVLRKPPAAFGNGPAGNS
jgi:SAM-dependent methyltransferase